MIVWRSLLRALATLCRGLAALPLMLGAGFSLAADWLEQKAEGGRR